MSSPAGAEAMMSGAGAAGRLPPRELGGGLVLRSPTASDADELAAFNVALHSDHPDDPEMPIGNWTRDLLAGGHPTTGPDDWTIVVDEAAGGRIVSTTVLISQSWSYDGLPVGCGRLELVATAASYRRRGLIREQFAVLHARSAAKGELMQAITGIPWFYRQFGYEMAMSLDAGRMYAWSRPGNLAAVESESYVWRPATEDDIPLLAQLYDVHCRSSMVARLRDPAQWRFEMSGAHRESPYAHDFRVIEAVTGEPVGYVDFRKWPPALYVRELAVADGHPWRPVLAFLVRALRGEADAYNATDPPKRIEWLPFGLGEEHAAYVALGDQLEPARPSYSWYVRVADLPAFLLHVRPVLERRLAESVMAGHTGALKLNFYGHGVRMRFEDGRLGDVETLDAVEADGADANLADLTVLQLVFGHRTLAELQHARADCYARNAEAKVLLGALFPRRASSPVGMG